MNNASLPLWASVTLHGREWIIHRASHRLPGRPQPCFVLQICSPTESALTGEFAAWEMFKQKPCVTESAPCDFGTRLPALRFPGSAWLVNKSSSIKAKVIKKGTGQKTPGYVRVWYKSDGVKQESIFTTHAYWRHIHCFTWSHKVRKVECSRESQVTC